MSDALTAELLLDNSAWANLGNRRLSAVRRNEIADWLEDGAVATCLPFLLEAGYSARNTEHFGSLAARLSKLPRAMLNAQVERRALEAQQQLVSAGHHRLPLVDVMVAALADVHGLGVLHYDKDYDLIQQHTDLRYRSEWLAPRGSLA